MSYGPERRHGEWSDERRGHETARRGGDYGERTRNRQGSFDRDRNRSRDRYREGPRNYNASGSNSLEEETAPLNRKGLSPDRARSRERERRRRKAQAECIRRAGGFKKLADSEGKEPVRLFWDGFQWVAKTGSSSSLLSDPILVNSTRKLRRLYFGNLPLHLGLTETNFQHIVFEEMKKRGYCNSSDENPVLCVWFAKDKGNYGFVEFASVEETERALTMDGMDCLGVSIKVSRPNDYCSATQAPTVLPILAQQSAQLLADALPNLATGQLAAAIVAGGVSQLADARLLLFRAMVQATDVDDEAEYAEILEDIKEGCEVNGKVLGCAIVTPSVAKSVPSFESGEGDVYVMFETSQGIDGCIAAMGERKYFERPIRCQRLASELWHASVSQLPTAQIGKVEEKESSEAKDRSPPPAPE